MPSVTSFNILFDRQNRTYMPGDIVSGRVVFDLNQTVEVRGLKIFAKGFAKVHWTESKSRRDAEGRSHSYTEHFQSEEEYFDTKYHLLGNSNDSSRVTLKPGYQEYPFNFALPVNIPCSYEGDYGHIRYTIKAVIDRPWKFDYECKEAFTVLSQLDLNQYADKCIGINDDIGSNFKNCCCFDAGSMRGKIQIPALGFVPGQTVNVVVKFDVNSDGVDIVGVTAKLEQKVTFHARSPHSSVKTETKQIKEYTDNGPFSKSDTSNLNLHIPAIPPSHLQHCGIIDLIYELIITVGVSGFHMDTDEKYSVLIGTVPLHYQLSVPSVTIKPGQFFQVPNTEPSAPNAPLLVPGNSSAMGSNMPMPMPVPMPMPMPMNNPSGSMPFAPPPYAPYGSVQPGVAGNEKSDQSMGFVPPQPMTTPMPSAPCAPPSYEECTLGGHSIRDQTDSDHMFGSNGPFAPRYPVFNFPQPDIPSKT